MIDFDLIISNIPENIGDRLGKMMDEIILKHSVNGKLLLNEDEFKSMLSEVIQASYSQAIDDVEAALQAINQSQN